MVPVPLAILLCPLVLQRRRTYFCLCSSGGSVGTYLASQSSHLSNASFYFMPVSLSPFFHHVLEEPYFPNMLLLWAFFIVPCTSMLSSSIYSVPQDRQDSIAQRDQLAQSRKASACRSECDIASKQTEIIYYCTRYCSTASTARHSPISPHEAAKQVRADQSATT